MDECTACMDTKDCPDCAQVREMNEQMGSLRVHPSQAVCPNHDPDPSLHHHNHPIKES